MRRLRVNVKRKGDYSGGGLLLIIFFYLQMVTLDFICYMAKG